MGAACCKPEPDDSELGGGAVKAWKRPKWRSEEPMTEEQLQRMRDEYWDTQPHYGGDRVIWDALKAACDADADTARIILDSAGVIVAAHDMTLCYDERGAKYTLPRYVVCEPTNLARGGGKASAQRAGSGGSQLELPAVSAGAASAGGSPAGTGAGGLPESAPPNQVAVR